MAKTSTTPNTSTKYSVNLAFDASGCLFKVDAAEAAELTRIRKKLKLTQLEAAHLAGGGKNAFSRYERGHTKPLAAVSNLFRLLDRHPELLNDLRAG